MRSAARVTSLRVLSSLVLCAALGCRPGAEAPRPPNVVLIVVDTLRADRLPEYGHNRPTSGALAEFLAVAHRFERCYTPGSWTRPSVASILSGLLPTRHRARHGDSDRLSDAVDSLPEVLSRHGWQTVGYSHNINIASSNGFNQGFDVFLGYEGGVLVYPDAEVMARTARHFLRTHGARPFFLYLQPMNPHGPYRVPPARRDDLLGHPPRTGFTYQGRIYRAIMNEGATDRRGEVTEEMLASLEETYDTAVRYTLDEIAGVLEQLRQADDLDDSLIVLTADHGEELFDHGGFSHGYSLYDEVVRVPLFVKLPGQTGPGRVIEQPVSLVDLHPTILELVGLPAVPDGDGASLARLLRGAASEGPTAREFVFEGDSDKRCVARGILAGRYKLLHIEGNYEGLEDELLLFDLESDPEELRNLAGERPAIAADLRQRMERLFAAAAARALPVEGGPPVELDRRTLEALGYL